MRNAPIWSPVAQALRNLVSFANTHPKLVNVKAGNWFLKLFYLPNKFGSFATFAAISWAGAPLRVVPPNAEIQTANVTDEPDPILSQYRCQ
jgi:hypothetical protein